MSATPTAAPERRAHSVPVSGGLLMLRRQVIAWSLGQGHPVNRDALAAVLGAAASAGLAPGSVWSSTDIGSLMWVGVTDWCQANGAIVPDAGVADTLLTYLRFLSAHRLFGKGSETAAALRRAVGEYGGRSPRASRHPAVRSGTGGDLAPVVPIA